MATSYYGFPTDEEDGYYEYEPLLRERNEEEQQEEAEGIAPEHLIIFLLGIPLLPIWTAFGIMVTFMKIGYFSKRAPERLPQLKFNLYFFMFLFCCGVVMYVWGINKLRYFIAHAI